MGVTGVMSLRRSPVCMRPVSSLRGDGMLGLHLEAARANSIIAAIYECLANFQWLAPSTLLYPFSIPSLG